MTSTNASQNKVRVFKQIVQVYLYMVFVRYGVGFEAGNKGMAQTTC